MKQTQNSGNFTCKFSISPGFARLKNLLSTKRARTITAMFAFFASLASLCFLQSPSFASVLRTPATYLNISTSTPNVDFQFNQSELSSSAFKTNNVTVNIQTDNATGATTYISSVDEATSLVHSNSGVSDNIASISSPLLSTAFSDKTWGYRVGSLATTAFNPIPKASAPAEILNTTSATPASNNLNIDFGVKVSPNLSSGAYSKQIVFTAVTNQVPTHAMFIPGPNFNATLNAINPGKDAKNFKKSNTPPANLWQATIVSTADSTRPIYMWYNPADLTVYWWSDADNVYMNQDASKMFMKATSTSINLASVDLDGINTVMTKNMSAMFQDVSALQHINFANINTSSVEDLSYMFMNATALTSLNLSGWDVRNNTTLYKIFQGCTGITHIDVSGWKNDKILTMDSLFRSLPLLRSINLAGFTTNNVESMTGMFAYTSVLNLDLSSFNTSKVKDMSAMFMFNSLMTDLDLSSFNTSKVKNMEGMFSTMTRLKNLNISSFNTSEVENMRAMFNNDRELSNFSVLSFDTRKVKWMTSMFGGVMKNQGSGVIDISSFSTEGRPYIEGMFTQIGANRIYASSNFSNNNIEGGGTGIFYGATHLVGGNGTTYNSSRVNKTYARIDAPGTPGYFTLKP